MKINQIRDAIPIRRPTMAAGLNAAPPESAILALKAAMHRKVTRHSAASKMARAHGPRLRMGRRVPR